MLEGRAGTVVAASKAEGGEASTVVVLPGSDGRRATSNRAQSTTVLCGRMVAASLAVGAGQSRAGAGDGRASCADEAEPTAGHAPPGENVPGGRAQDRRPSHGSHSDRRGEPVSREARVRKQRLCAGGI